MPYVTGRTEVELEVNIDEFLDDCSDSDYKYIVSYFKDNEIEGLEDVCDEDSFRNLITIEYSEILDKLGNIRLQLSNEDLDIIKEIIKKY